MLPIFSEVVSVRSITALGDGRITEVGCQGRHPLGDPV